MKKEVIKSIDENQSAIEKCLLDGDLSGLSDDQRASYYNQVCETVGLNPLTQPFQYIILNGKLKMYALKGATDQLRRIYGISCEVKSREKIEDFNSIDKIILHTSHHTHYVIGTGANDPQKMDPNASRETLDHSIMYILSVALEDGSWDHIESYSPDRAKRDSTVNLWQKISTREDPEWTKRYHDPDPSKRAFGGRVEVKLKTGETIIDELAVANAHPSGAKPFKREDYIRKFKSLTEQLLDHNESDRFLDIVQELAALDNSGLRKINIEVKSDLIEKGKLAPGGIF